MKYELELTEIHIPFYERTGFTVPEEVEKEIEEKEIEEQTKEKKKEEK